MMPNLIIQMIESFILFLMAAAPNAAINKDTEYRTEVVESVYGASMQYDVQPLWLTYNIYRESSFRKSVVSKSKLREFGLCQVHGIARRMCEQAFDLDLRTVRGQVYCMASLFEHGNILCGDQIKSLSWFVSGRCKPTKHVRKKIIIIEKRFVSLLSKSLRHSR